MEFLLFCQAHGILIDHPPPIGQWKRYHTTDHLNKRNGAVKFMGTHAFVQNHATETEVSVWKSDKVTDIDLSKIARMASKADDEKKKRQTEAKEKAIRMIKESVLAHHQYFLSKGFPDEIGNVIAKDGKKTLLIPMRVDGEVVGLQTIDEDGSKKFLFGQRTSDATFVFDNKGVNFFCEGYATALSLRYALKSLKRQYVIHVCFSAGNLLKVAQRVGKGYVIADNDDSGTGERIAKQIGMTYWISEKVGEDANDFHQRVGLFKFTQTINKLLMVRG